MKNKFAMVLLSAVVAFALWVYVITVISPESTMEYQDIPVVLDGESLLNEKGLMVVTENLPTADLVLFGDRVDLNKLNSSNLTLKVSLNSISEPGDYRLQYSVSYPTDITRNAVDVEDKDPAVVNIRVERQITREVPVNVVYQNAVDTDYIAHTDNDVLDYEKVVVVGPEPVIEQIKEARITIDLKDRTESFSESYRYQLCDQDGNPVDSNHVVTNVAEVNVTLSIQRVKEIPLVLEVVSGGGATETTSNITITPETIKVSGSDTVLEKLEELSIGTIELGEIDGDTTLEFPLVIPNGVTNLSDVTTAQVSVKFPDLLKKNISIPAENFVLQNVPEGLAVEMITQQLTVTVRGPKSLVERMQASDIIVTIDFAGREKGNVKLTAQVTMGSSYSRVGVLSTYSVSATLQDAAEELDDDATGPST